MSIPILITYRPEYSCYENLIVALSKYWNKSYEMMSIKAWSFSYDLLCTSNKLGLKIKKENGTDYNLLQKYHGIKCISNHESDSYEVINHIKSEIKYNRPVSVYIDTFWCPWYTTNYKKIKSTHYCLVLDVDASNNMKIVDSQFACNGSVLSFENYIQGKGKYITYEQVPIKCDLTNWREMVWGYIKSLHSNASKSMFDQIRDFSSEVLTSLDIKNEIIGYENNPFSAPIYENVFHIGMSRRQFLNSLLYIAKQCNCEELIYIANKMGEIANKWSSTFGMLCKMYYIASDGKIINKLYTKINELADEEQEVFDNLKTLCTNNTFKLKHKSFYNVPEHNTDYIKEMYFVNIKNYVNNKGFGNSLDYTCTAEMSNGGKYFYVEEIESYTNLTCDNMSFKTLINEDNYNDNISCDGQKIRISSIEANYIMFLGCSELGDHLEYVNVEYQDGVSENISVGFTNWSKANSLFKEVLAFRGKIAQRDSDKIFVFPFLGYIYAKNFKLRGNSPVVSIQLPVCPNMHIYSITFGMTNK